MLHAARGPKSLGQAGPPCQLCSCGLTPQAPRGIMTGTRPGTRPDSEECTGLLASCKTVPACFGYPTWPCRRQPALQWVPHLAVQMPPCPEVGTPPGLADTAPAAPIPPGLAHATPAAAGRPTHCPRAVTGSPGPPHIQLHDLPAAGRRRGETAAVPARHVRGRSRSQGRGPGPEPEPGAAARRPEHTRNAEPPAASRFAPASPATCSRPPPLVAAGRRPSPASAQGPLASMAAATTVWRTGRREGQKAAALELHAYGVGVDGAGERVELLLMGVAGQRISATDSLEKICLLSLHQHTDSGKKENLAVV